MPLAEVPVGRQVESDTSHVFGSKYFCRVNWVGAELPQHLLRPINQVTYPLHFARG